MIRWLIDINALVLILQVTTVTVVKTWRVFFILKTSGRGWGKETSWFYLYISHVHRDASTASISSSSCIRPHSSSGDCSIIWWYLVTATATATFVLSQANYKNSDGSVTVTVITISTFVRNWHRRRHRISKLNRVHRVGVGGYNIHTSIIGNTYKTKKKKKWTHIETRKRQKRKRKEKKKNVISSKSVLALGSNHCKKKHFYPRNNACGRTVISFLHKKLLGSRECVLRGRKWKKTKNGNQNQKRKKEEKDRNVKGITSKQL